MWIAKSCLDKYECDGQPLEWMHPVNGIPTRCSACVRIKQAVQELNNLVVRRKFFIPPAQQTCSPPFDIATLRAIGRNTSSLLASPFQTCTNRNADPYLTTGGMAAAPPKSDWESDPEEKKPFDWDNRDDGSAGDGMTKKERQEFQDKIVKSFVDTAGQGLTEEEVYGKDAVDDGRESRASTQVDDDGDWDGKTEIDGEGMLCENEMEMEKEE